MAASKNISRLIIPFVVSSDHSSGAEIHLRRNAHMTTADSACSWNLSFAALPYPQPFSLPWRLCPPHPSCTRPLAPRPSSKRSPRPMTPLAFYLQHRPQPAWSCLPLLTPSSTSHRL